MPGKDVWEQLKDLRGRPHNLKPSDIEKLARQAGWVYDRTTGSHATYVKEGFPNILTIKLGKLKGNLARRLLNVIESSLHYEERRSDGNYEER